MPRDLNPPITYLITNGETTVRTSPRSNEFLSIVKLTKAAVEAELSLVQIREKHLSARVLHELVVRCAEVTRGSKTRLLVNDRVDIALTTSADGVQLTSKSISAATVRECWQEQLLIGVSTHSLAEAITAREDGADFVLFGPVFETESKRVFGPAQGLDKLRQITQQLATFPVLAIGGISTENSAECFRAGASGVAAIRLFGDGKTLAETVKAVRQSAEMKR